MFCCSASSTMHCMGVIEAMFNWRIRIDPAYARLPSPQPPFHRGPRGQAAGDVSYLFYSNIRFILNY